MNNLFHNLPDDIKILIWEFDNTYKQKYNSCIKELKNVKKLHKLYKKRNYGVIRKNNICDFSKYYKKFYNNKNHSKMLFKYYYGNIFKI